MTPDLLPANMRAKITVHPITDCWEWTGARNSTGYGCTTNGRGGSVLAHRTSYELLVGPIADGLTIDHLCRNKVCVNPDHMEVVTRAENSARGMATRHTQHRIWVESAPVPGPIDNPLQRWLDRMTRTASNSNS